MSNGSNNGFFKLLKGLTKKMTRLRKRVRILENQGKQSALLLKKQRPKLKCLRAELESIEKESPQANQLLDFLKRMHFKLDFETLTTTVTFINELYDSEDGNPFSILKKYNLDLEKVSKLVGFIRLLNENKED
ncbi:hypothetical protein ACOI1C_08160 [Bacillus sp. DJP31]|uniref:hypothetical protein n=1 Tax=Bacillus sp. DJP31 TaxID=3409789 RepID=UPI003BB5E247